MDIPRRTSLAAAAALVLVGTSSLLSAGLKIAAFESATSAGRPSLGAKAHQVSNPTGAIQMSCFDLPVSSALLDPSSCWLTDPTSAVLVGTDPGDARDGVIVIVQGQRQNLVDLAGSGSLHVETANQQSACVTNAQGDYRSVNLVSGTVAAGWSSTCSLSTAGGTVGTSAVSAPAATESSPTEGSEITNTVASEAPSVTPSYYEYYSYYARCDSGISGSCPLYEQGASTHTPPENGLVVLDFGSPCYLPSDPSVYGVEMFFQPTCISDSALQPLVDNWISGYESQNSTNTVNLTLALGTSNSYNGVDSNYALTNPEMTSSGQSWYQDLVGTISTSGLSAPLTIWGADDLEEAAVSEQEWSTGPASVAWVQGFGAASPAGAACPLNQSGYMADYGDDVLGGSGNGSADDWTVPEIYDVSYGLPVACAEPEIYFPDMATEWQALSQWALNNGYNPIAFSGVMTEIEAGTLSPNAAWSDLESDSGQSPPIPSVTTISWNLQNLPVVNSVSPQQGPITGGTQVQISGTNLSGAEAVDFGDNPASSFTINGAGSLTATAPPGSVGFVDVTVQTAVGTSTPGGADGFVYTAPAAYHPVAPARIEDTRPGSGEPGSGDAPGVGQVLSMQVSGIGPIPATRVSAVVLNLTVIVGPTASPETISVFPTGLAVPSSPTINLTSAGTQSDLVEVALGRGGSVSVYSGAGGTQIIADVEGWYDTSAPGSGAGLYNPVDPTRIVDTRTGQTLGAGDSLVVQVAGSGGIPSSGAEAAVLSVTVIGAAPQGVVQVEPTGTSPDNTSLVDFYNFQPVANQVVAMLGSGGDVTVYNDSSGSLNLLIDVEGWYTNGSGATTGSAFNVQVPTLVVDTRSGSGTPYSGDTIPSDQTLRVGFPQLGGIPSQGAVAVVAATTSFDATSVGDLTVFPEDQSENTSSEIDWIPGQISNNLLVVGLGANGGVEFQNNSPGIVDLVLEVTGWFGTPTSASMPVVNSVSPASGPVVGGTEITITGQNLSGAESVSMGGALATDVVVVSATSITATTPAGSAGFASVGVTTASGSSLPQGADGFLYEADGGYHPLTPTRIADTRTGTGLPGSDQGPGPGQILDLPVTGAGGVPTTGVAAVVLNVTVTGATNEGYVTAYPTGLAVPGSSTIDFFAGQTVANLAVVAVGRGGEISIYNALGWTQVIVDIEGWYDDSTPSSGAGLFNPLSPQRIADTRKDSNAPYSGQTLGPGTSLTVQVSGVGGVPSSGVEAVVVNLTGLDATTADDLTVYPTGQPMPDSSNVNFFPGEVVPNQDIVELGTDGQITITNSSGSADVIVDVAGWFSNGIGGSTTGLVYHPVATVRALDTRTTAPISADQTLTVQLAGLPGVPVSGPSAVAMNVTTTDPAAAGDLQMWPGGGVQPDTSELNWLPGYTTENLVIMGLGSDGTVSFGDESPGSVELVLDVAGWFGAA